MREYSHGSCPRTSGRVVSCLGIRVFSDHQEYPPLGQETELSPSCDVVRLVSNIQSHFPPGMKKPLPAAFDLSGENKADAKTRKRQPLLSVWNLDLIPLDRARSKRSQDTTAFRLNVGQVCNVRVPEDVLSLIVRHDLLEHDPDGDAHAGIQGLHRPRGIQKIAYKAMKSELADVCTRCTEE